MSNQITFQERNLNGIAMENIINVADCCRACLRIDCSLTPTSAQDNDSIKFCDKLLSCVSEVMWQKEGLPSLICATCIERLRVAYDFRNICLQSDHTLHRYISHLQEDSKQNLGARPLTTPTKFDFAIPTTTQDDIPISVEEPQNAEYLHLKHFLDNDEDLAKK
jgi:KRAB domain-containing zinc finger protein